tara:strand:+ start:894 stop:1916 length:1023 start_codon:yes stop_codon:yes gene_type:complete
LNSAKFVVIGSNSFSGSHFVCEALKQGHKVIGISRSDELESFFLPYKWKQNNENKIIIDSDKFSFHSLDINLDLKKIISIIDNFSPEYIINFAAQGMVAESWLNPTHWYKTNLLSQVALHDELRTKKYIKKYVHVTTPEVYGSTDKGWIDEKTPFNPTTPYAVSRAACDLHLRSFFKAYDFPVVFTRSANVFGAGQQLYRIIPRSILSVRTGTPLQLHGGGYSERSFIHIQDVVEATLLLAFKADPGSTWHLSTKEAISIRNLVKIICELGNVEFESIVQNTQERLGKDQNYLLSSNAIRNKYNWTDKISLKEGLRETFKWVDDNIEMLKSIPWTYIHKS